jgi:hypothetical protein
VKGLLDEYEHLMVNIYILDVEILWHMFIRQLMLLQCHIMLFSNYPMELDEK